MTPAYSISTKFSKPWFWTLTVSDRNQKSVQKKLREIVWAFQAYGFFFLCFPVTVAPLAPVFDSFTGLFDDGELRSITCHTNGSRPAANIFWMLNGVGVNSTSVQVIRNSDDTYFVRGTLIRHLTRNMENQVLSCVVTNPVLQKTYTQSLNRSVVLLPNCKSFDIPSDDRNHSSSSVF